MKRIFAVLAAAMLVFGVATSASAALVEGDFFVSIFGNDVELALDMGAIDSDGSMASSSVTATFELSYFNVTSWADLSVAGLGGVQSTTNYANFAILSGSTDEVDLSKLSINTLTDAYPQSDDEAIQTDVYDISGTSFTGDWGSIYAAALSADSMVSLSLFDDWEIGDDPLSISMNIYTSSWTRKATEYTDTGLVLTLTLIDENTVTATVAPVPVPAAVLLLGSGLLGLIGIRRRNA